MKVRTTLRSGETNTYPYWGQKIQVPVYGGRYRGWIFGSKPVTTTAPSTSSGDASGGA